MRTTAAARKKAQMCQPFHGLDGLSKQPDAPNLAGQVEDYFVKLTEFRDCVRVNEQMSVVAPTLSNADIADLAAYYASIKVTVPQARNFACKAQSAGPNSDHGAA